MDTKEFQRARRPEQITARRTAILTAAAELFDEEGPLGAGLNAIAARAGFTKSNVYRYFESREEVLLSLYLDGLARATDDIEAALAACEPSDIEGIAIAVTDQFLAHPRFCRLLSILSSVLEQNVSEDTIVAMKLASNDYAVRLSASLQRVLPELQEGDWEWAWTMIALFLVGFWPAAFPAAAAARVLEREDFRDMQPVPERDLYRGVVVILRGIIADAAIAAAAEAEPNP